jgi:hypothetical protein
MRFIRNLNGFDLLKEKEEKIVAEEREEKSSSDFVCSRVFHTRRFSWLLSGVRWMMCKWNETKRNETLKFLTTKQNNFSAMLIQPLPFFSSTLWYEIKSKLFEASCKNHENCFSNNVFSLKGFLRVQKSSIYSRTKQISDENCSPLYLFYHHKVVKNQPFVNFTILLILSSLSDCWKKGEEEKWKQYKEIIV